MSKHIVKSVIEGLGSEAIRSKLQVSHHAVRYAKTDGVFPAAWYAGLRELCEAAQIDCPMDAFNWKGATEPEAGAAQ